MVLIDFTPQKLAETSKQSQQRDDPTEQSREPAKVSSRPTQPIIIDICEDLSEDDEALLPAKRSRPNPF